MIANYVGRWTQAQQDQFRLCEEIDQIADRLPLHDVDAFATLTGRMKAVLDHAQSFEERELFPLLEAMSPQMRPLLITFRSHHASDRRTEQSIADALVVPAPDAAQLENLKIRMASFAEVLRRHVQFEEAIATALFASRRVDEKRAVQ